MLRALVYGLGGPRQLRPVAAEGKIRLGQPVSVSQHPDRRALSAGTGILIDYFIYINVIILQINFGY